MLKLRYDVFGAEVLGNAKMAGKYEFPATPGVRLKEPPATVVPFDRMGEVKKGDWLHFYVHDKRFCNLLSRRESYGDLFNLAGGFFGTDNSLYRDLPLAEQIHSCYLNRAIDYYLHSLGKPVVANVSWGDWRSFEFCCDGVEPGTTIAMSTYGSCRSPIDRSHFEEGFVFVVERLRPFSICLHGSVWPKLGERISYHGVKILKIPTRREIVDSAKEVRHG